MPTPQAIWPINGPLCENIMPTAIVTCTESFTKFGHVAFETCEWTETYRQTDRHTDTLIAILRTSAMAEVIIMQTYSVKLKTDSISDTIC